MSTRPSDNEVQAYIRGTTSYKISFTSKAIDSPNIFSTCNCSAAAKGQLCKHIWAGLLKIEQNQSDFLEGKNSIEIAQVHAPEQKLKTGSPSIKPMSETQIASKAAFKEKQNDYRKLQYQKQKLIMQKKKLANKNKITETIYEPPFEVAKAMTFFSKNGFLVSIPVDTSILNLAKKKLSRIFHPDAGGTHDEILELNKSFDILINFAKLNRP